MFNKFFNIYLKANNNKPARNSTFLIKNKYLILEFNMEELFSKSVRNRDIISDVAYKKFVL